MSLSERTATVINHMNEGMPELVTKSDAMAALEDVVLELDSQRHHYQARLFEIAGLALKPLCDEGQKP